MKRLAYCQFFHQYPHAYSHGSKVRNDCLFFVMVILSLSPHQIHLEAQNLYLAVYQPHSVYSVCTQWWLSVLEMVELH